MTGVLEVAAAASAIAAFARSRHEKERTEEKVAADLYARFFHADLLDVSPDRASTTSSERFQNLDANAAAAVRAIERYQKERKRWFLWMSSSSEQTGDTRTRVLEEMKQWFLRVSDGGSIGAVEVSTRLDYCWHFLLHSSSFEGHNQTSFLGTLAEACPDGLSRCAAAWTFDVITEVVRVASEFRFALDVGGNLGEVPDEGVVMGRTGAGAPDPVATGAESTALAS
ncbi:unnamed protein product [Polarella glacialis]|uniref:Uncharacterized protein n=1 Tax=Polarella glacialis TaxID=89957 RepID=A0A813LLN7_POLGL|nr:unnamed protein product [Polarella glacialis]